MAGKKCFGANQNNGGNLRESKAFCEGRAYRASGTAVQKPIADNPHESGSESKTAWDLGWNDAHAGAGTYVGIQGCCAALGNIVA